MSDTETEILACEERLRLADKVFSLRFARVWNRSGRGWKVALGTVTMILGA